MSNGTGTETINRYGKLTGHEDTASGRIAYVTDPTHETTCRIRLDRNATGEFCISGETVNERGAVIHAFITQFTRNEERAREVARAYWMAASAGISE